MQGGNMFMQQQGIISREGLSNKLECNFTAADNTAPANYVPDIGTWLGESPAGKAKIYNNTLAQSVPTGSGFNVVWSPTDTVTTIIADIKVFITSVAGLQGIFVRGENVGKGYGCVLYNGNASIYYGSIVSNLSLVASTPFSFSFGTTYQLKAILDGNDIHFYVDDVFKVTGTDARSQGNYVGFRGWYTNNIPAGTMMMDNLVAY